MPWILGNIHEAFILERWKRLDVKGNVVVDVGATAGDFSIYASLNGAKKILAYEMDKKYFDLLQTNLKENKISNVKTFNKKFDMETCMEDLNREIDEERLVMKMDIEGDEYEQINGKYISSFTRFCEIIMEYHYGCSELVNLLENNGYKVETTPPQRIGKLRAGYLYAVK